MSRQNKESANLKAGQWKLSSLRKTEEKQTEHKRPMGHYQVDQHKYHRSPRRREKGVERIFK